MPVEIETEPEVVFDQERTVVAVRASAFHTVMAAIQAAAMYGGAALEAGDVKYTEGHGMRLKFGAAELAVRGLGHFRGLAKNDETRHARLLRLDHDLRVATLELVQAQCPNVDLGVEDDFYETYLRGLETE